MTRHNSIEMDVYDADEGNWTIKFDTTILFILLLHYTCVSCALRCARCPRPSLLLPRLFVRSTYLFVLVTCRPYLYFFPAWGSPARSGVARSDPARETSVRYFKFYINRYKFVLSRRFNSILFHRTDNNTSSIDFAVNEINGQLNAEWIGKTKRE